MIRVITGKAKGKKLISPKHGTRPLTDRIKTSIFDLIKNSVPGANVLDLYAGSGSFGIEALSRGSNSATFVDISQEAINCIKNNLSNTRFVDQAKVFKLHVNDFITTTSERFDIIFLDPPFNDKTTPDFTKLAKILNPGQLLIFRTIQNRKIDFTKIPLNNIYQKIYGKSKLIFFQQICVS